MTTSAQPRPMITPDEQKALDAIRYMDEHQEAAPDSVNMGRFKHHIEALAEALRLDGPEEYQRERARFFNENAHLFALFAAAGTSQPDQQKDDKHFASGKDGKRIIKLHSVEDIYSLPDTVYLINRILEYATLSLLYGMSGTGKTFSALHIALCIAHGLPWMGRRVKKGPVWYVNTEGARGLKKRLQAWYKEHSDLAPTTDFKVIPWSLDLRDNFQDLLNTIEEMSTHEKPSLIIFDNFSMCTTGINQNLQEEVTPILKALNGLVQDHECNVMIIHHTNKEGDVNGTMAFRNHVDTMIELKREDKADKNSPILFCCQKPRDDEPFSDIKTELKQIVLHTDPDTLESITSCVVIEALTPIKQVGLKDVAQNILDLLGDDAWSYTDWMKEAINKLHISKPTFDRYKNELLATHHIEKCRVGGVKYEQYRKISPAIEALAREKLGSEGENE